ncbi:uncharacterized protein LOC143465360 isoform X2 [Clavelina lepadiformis]|uniref:uncharacterized protein LOC143465360 isoform X2 n=1 Tax=Clavelina lepadiformis TaxID=159417 RepID=UPI0040426213
MINCVLPLTFVVNLMLCWNVYPVSCLECHSGFEIDTNGVPERFWNITQCPESEMPLACFRVETIFLSLGFFRTEIAIGRCVNKSSCNATECSALSQNILGVESLESGQNEVICDTICCDDNNCNSETVAEIRAATTTTTITATSTNITDTTENTTGNIAHTNEGGDDGNNGNDSGGGGGGGVGELTSSSLFVYFLTLCACLWEVLLNF